MLELLLPLAQRFRQTHRLDLASRIDRIECFAISNIKTFDQFLFAGQREEEQQEEEEEEEDDGRKADAAWSFNESETLQIRDNDVDVCPSARARDVDHGSLSSLKVDGRGEDNDKEESSSL